MPQLRATLQRLIRENVESGGTLNQIATDAGISYPVLWRFVRGERGLSLPTIERLADYFNVSLQPRARERLSKKSRKS